MVRRVCAKLLRHQPQLAANTLVLVTVVGKATREAVFGNLCNTSGSNAANRRKRQAFSGTTAVTAVTATAQAVAKPPVVNAAMPFVPLSRL